MPASEGKRMSTIESLFAAYGAICFILSVAFVLAFLRWNSQVNKRNKKTQLSRAESEAEEIILRML